MMELKKYKFGEICDIIAGGDAPKIVSVIKTKETPFPVYSNGITDEGLYGYTDKARVLKPAFTVSARGTIGVSFRRNEPYFPIVRLLSVIPKSNDVDLGYLFYYSKLLSFEKDGSVQQQLTVPMFANVDIFLPDIDTQQKTASVLSNLDSKISLNRAINRNLEALAKQLYDYWFVQFDFPDENGKPYKSSGGKMVWNEVLKREVPEGWEVKKIGEVLGKVKNTPRLVTNEYLHKGKYPIIDQTRDVYYAGFTNREDAVSTQFPAVVFGDHSCAVKYVNFPFVRGADGTQVMLPNDTRLSVEYLYFFVQNVKISEGYARHYSFLKESPIILPKQEIVDLFKNAVSKWFKMITLNRIEITILTYQRDELLPLLMNGQVAIE